GRFGERVVEHPDGARIADRLEELGGGEEEPRAMPAPRVLRERTEELGATDARLAVFAHEGEALDLRAAPDRRAPRDLARVDEGVVHGRHLALVVGDLDRRGALLGAVELDVEGVELVVRHGRLMRSSHACAPTRARSLVASGRIQNERRARASGEASTLAGFTSPPTIARRASCSSTTTESAARCASRRAPVMARETSLPRPSAEIVSRGARRSKKPMEASGEAKAARRAGSGPRPGSARPSTCASRATSASLPAWSRSTKGSVPRKSPKACAAAEKRDAGESGALTPS